MLQQAATASGQGVFRNPVRVLKESDLAGIAELHKHASETAMRFKSSTGVDFAVKDF